MPELEFNFAALKKSIFADISLGDFLGIFKEKKGFDLGGLFTGLGSLLAGLFAE